MKAILHCHFIINGQFQFKYLYVRYFNSICSDVSNRAQLLRVCYIRAISYASIKGINSIDKTTINTSVKEIGPRNYLIRSLMLICLFIGINEHKLCFGVQLLRKYINVSLCLLYYRRSTLNWLLKKKYLSVM